MDKIKLTKTELKAQTDALKRFSRFLPMLQLKKQQLQAEIAGITAKADDVTARERARRDEMSDWVGLIARDPELLGGLVKVTAVRTGHANVAGVEIPIFEGIDAQIAELDTWSTPVWAEDAAAAIRDVMALKAERQVLEKQRALITEELRMTSQRVNLFEKVKIPACRENIRVIKIAIGDEQTAAVTRGKIAKSRGVKETMEEEDVA